MRRVLARTLQGALTLGIAAAAATLVIAGAGLLGRNGAEAARTIAPPVPVAVVQLQILPGYTVTRRFTGQIEAAARADLGFEFGGRIDQVRVQEGDPVEAGAALATLDRALLLPRRAALEAELAALAADAELARLTLARNAALVERGHRAVAAEDEARTGLARADAGMAALRAQIEGIDVQLEKSVLRAPFAARIGARLADPGQTVAAGQPVLVLHAQAPALLRVALPPDLAAALQPGQRAQAEIDGQVHAVRLDRLRPDLDPATRSRAAVFQLPDGVMPVLGQTATLQLTLTIAEPGFWAPVAALREGARGSWTLLALADEPDGARAVPVAVEVIHADGAQVFLRGALPKGARIVATAPDRIAPGQAVRPVTE